MRQVDERFVCDKEVRLWSKFEFNRVPGDTSAGPNELQTPGKRSKYVTRLSYIAREAGYEGYIVTKVPRNERPRHEYPEPKSYVTHSYLPQQLDSIIWDNYKIIGDLTWTGEATRHFKHKKSRVCTRHTICYAGVGRTTLPPFFSFCKTATKREYPVYQEESVVKP